MSDSDATAVLEVDDLLGPPQPDPATGGAELEHAVSSGQFLLHYQPVLDVGNASLIALKALPRWNHPQGGLQSPRRFVPQIVRAGRTLDLARATLHCAALDLLDWLQAGYAPVRVDIELLQKQFLDPALPAVLDALQSRHSLPAGSICLQISEAILRQDPVRNLEILERLKACGVRLALSNFGGGAFVVQELAAFPFERINIGAAFVQDLVTIADDAALARQVFDAAREMGKRVGADGVETAIEFELLREKGCDEVQGPYFVRAAPNSEIARLLAQGGSLAEAALPRKPRSLLLVDDEPNILNALRRLLRADGYEIATAGSAAQAMALLEQSRFDVIVCDQRMPGMSGVEFFGIARQQYPDTVRLILSGYTELQSVIDAVNEGSIYKFLCKPWDDVQLRGHVAEAFRRKELGDENQRLSQEVYSANQRLAQANLHLESVLEQQQMQIRADEVSLQIIREALHHVPVPVFGLDDDNMLAFSNLAAQAILQNSGALLGCDAEQLMPELAGATGDSFEVCLNTNRYMVKVHKMGSESQSRGKLLLMTKAGHERTT